jgi:glycosyltransferase 2 family protein
MAKQTSKHWQVGIGLLISAVFLFLAVRNIHWPEVWFAWQGARVDLLLLGALLLVACWGVSSVIWRVLLSPAPGLRVRDTFAYICIGFLANTVLPFRLGELARATLIGRKKGLGISRALGSIALGRVFDLLTLISIILVVALAMDIPPVIQTGLASLAFGGVVALLFLMFLAFHQERLPRFTAILTRIMPQRLAEKAITLVQNFSTGANVLRSPGRLMLVVALCVVGGSLSGITVLTWIRAFHLPVPWYGAFFVLVVVNLGSAIPSSPGYIGVYHYLAVLALSIWVPDRNAALAYAIGTHALNMLANVGMGSYFLACEGLSLQSLKSQVATREGLADEEPPTPC